MIKWDEEIFQAVDVNITTRQELAFMCSILAGDHAYTINPGLWKIILNAIAAPDVKPTLADILAFQQTNPRMISRRDVTAPIPWVERDSASLLDGEREFLIPTLGVDCVIYKPPVYVEPFELSTFPAAALAPPVEDAGDKGAQDWDLPDPPRSPSPDPFANFVDEPDPFANFVDEPDPFANFVDEPAQDATLGL